MPVAVENPGKIYFTDKGNWVWWDGSRSQFRITSNIEGAKRRTGSECYWLSWALNATWREWKPEPEPDLRDYIYTGAEAFALMAETPGRAFTPLGSAMSEFRVYSTDNGGEFRAMWSGALEPVRYEIPPFRMKWQWREYLPKVEKKPEEPQPRRYRGRDVPGLVMDTPNRKFKSATRSQQVWIDEDGCLQFGHGPNFFDLVDLRDEWIEVNPPTSLPTTGLSFTEAVARVRSGEAKRLWREGYKHRPLYRDAINACDWKVQ